MKKWLYWGFPAVWMGIIYIASDQPYEKQDLKPFFNEYIDFSFLEPFVNTIEFTYHNSMVSVETLGINGFVEFFIRKGAHFAVFLVLFLLFVYAFRKSTQLNRSYVIGLSIVFTIAYAIADELHQGFTPNRTPYAGDVLIDSIGAFFGALIYVLVSSKWEKLRKFKKKG